MQVAVDLERVLAALEFSPEFAYFSGSIYEGFGNEESDIDIFVLTHALPSLDSVVRTVYLDEDRLDIEYWPLEIMPTLCSQLDRTDVSAEKHVGELSIDECDFLHRLLIGEAFIGETQFRHWQAQVNVAQLNRVNASRNAAIAQKKVSEALTRSDPDARNLLLGEALYAATERVLNLHGEHNVTAKWIYRKVDRQAVTYLAQRLEEFHGEYSSSQAFAERTVHVIEQLLNTSFGASAIPG